VKAVLAHALKLRPRFSLRTLAVFLLLVTSGVGLAHSYRMWVTCLTIPLPPDTSWHSARMSRDGKCIVTVGATGEARIWSAENGECLHVLSGHKGLVRPPAFSHDVARVATSGSDGKVMIWDVATGRRVETLDVGASVLWAMFSNRGKSVLTSSGGGPSPNAPPHEFTLWSVETGKAIVRFPPESACWFPPDRDYIVCREADSGLKSLCDAATGERLGVVAGGRSGPWVLRDPATQKDIRSLGAREIDLEDSDNTLDFTALVESDMGSGEWHATTYLPGAFLGCSMGQHGGYALAGTPESLSVMRYRPGTRRALAERLEFWLTVALAAIFIWSVIRDRRRLARTG